MVDLMVSGRSSLFAELVSALLRSALPDAAVGFESADEGYGGGVRVRVPQTGRWLFVSTNSRPDTGAARSLSEGACAVLTLGSRPEDFRRAINVLVDGEASYIPMDILRWLATTSLADEEQAAELPRKKARLTPREIEVLRLVSLGFSNAEIASTLTISGNTVRTHLHSLYGKLGASSRTRLLLNAGEAGLIEAVSESTYASRSA
jgi:DNA-binding NarL/FixJ family response regulator